MTPSFVRTPDYMFEGLRDWPFDPHYLEVDGLRVHYIDDGPRTAKPFLLVHGEPSWSYLYRHWVKPLVDAGFRVVAPDHVGFGRSDKVTEDDWYVIDRHVEVQRSLIEALDLRSIHLFCQDWGGPISLRNACDMPERYARLFISHTWLHHDGYEYTDRLRWWREASQDPAVLGGDMPTAVVVVESLRRDGHDKEALRVAYDAPFIGYESKAGARGSRGACPSPNPKPAAQPGSSVATPSFRRWGYPHISCGATRTQCSRSTTLNDGPRRSPRRLSTAFQGPGTSSKKTPRKTALQPSSHERPRTASSPTSRAVAPFATSDGSDGPTDRGASAGSRAQIARPITPAWTGTEAHGASNEPRAIQSLGGSTGSCTSMASRSR